MTSTLQNCCKSRSLVLASSIFGRGDAHIPHFPSPGVAPVAACLLFVLCALLLVCFVYNKSFSLGRLAPSPAERCVPCLALLYSNKFDCFRQFLPCTSWFFAFSLVFVLGLGPVVKLPTVFLCAVRVSAPFSANYRLSEIVVLSRLSQQSPSGAVLTAGSDTCACVPCELVFCVLVLLCLCLSVPDLSAAFMRAVRVSAPFSANFRLSEIVVFSRLSQQSPSGAVLAVGSNLCLVFLFVCFVSFFCRVLCFCFSSYIHIHSLITSSLYALCLLMLCVPV